MLAIGKYNLGPSAALLLVRAINSALYGTPYVGMNPGGPERDELRNIMLELEEIYQLKPGDIFRK